MRSLIRKAESTAAQVRNKPHSSVADVLFLIDENAFIRHTESNELFMMHLDFRREAALAGVISDLYRIADLPELDLSQYKLIDLCDCPELPELPPDRTMLFSYLDGLPAGISVSEVTGKFPAGEVTFEGIFSGGTDLPELPLPRVAPVLTDGMQIHGRFADWSPAAVSKGKIFYTALPILKWRQFSELCRFAGCRCCGEIPCTVYGDSRFTAVFNHTEPGKFTFQMK